MTGPLEEVVARFTARISITSRRIEKISVFLSAYSHAATATARIRIGRPSKSARQIGFAWSGKASAPASRIARLIVLLICERSKDERFAEAERDAKRITLLA